MNAPINDPLIQPMVSGFGKYATDRDGTTPEALTTINFYEVRDLVDKPQQGVEKDRAQWLIPSTHPSRKGHDKSGKRPLIWADVDAPVLTIQQTGDQLRDLLGGADFEVYASRSATAEKQKCRILVPLAQALPPDQWLIVSEVFRVKLAERGIETDPASEKLGQVLYLPNKGEFYDTSSSCDGVLFEPLGVWAAEVAERKAELVRQAAEVKRAQEAARTRREALKAARSTSGFNRAIDAFNATYDVSEVLTRNGYDQRGDSFRHPGSATGSYSATVRTAADGVRRVHTLSTSDPLYTEGGGVGAHDAFSAFCVLEHGGDRNAALREAGNQWLTIGGESWNTVQRREWAQQREAERVFEALDPETGELTPEIHPLARFVQLRKKPQAVKWVVPGVIEQGVVTIAGARGVGKTTALLPLALSAAGLHEPGYALAPHPERWRHVIYAVEQVEQVERILAGLVDCSGIGITWEQVEERLHLVEAVRLNVDTVVQVAGTYRKQFTRVVDGVEIPPLVVFDTQAASFDMENENDNAEASRIMAALKQRFERLPVWIVGHVAKASIGRSEVQTLTARGAGAFEADSIANLYLTTDEKTNQRFLFIGKRRAEPRFGDDLLIESGDRIITGFNEWGEPEDVHLRWGIVRPMEQTRAELREQAQEAAERERRGDMRQAILDAVEAAWLAGEPINRTGLRNRVGLKAADVGQEVEALLSEGWLREVEVPRAQRTNVKRDRFLVKLDTSEHDEFMRSGTVPEAKKAIPQSWRKA